MCYNIWHYTTAEYADSWLVQRCTFNFIMTTSNGEIFHPLRLIKLIIDQNLASEIVIEIAQFCFVYSIGSKLQNQ